MRHLNTEHISGIAAFLSAIIPDPKKAVRRAIDLTLEAQKQCEEYNTKAESDELARVRAEGNPA